MPANSRLSVTNELTKNPSLQTADKTRMFAEAKAGRDTVQVKREPSGWVKENGLLFWKDVKEAQRLKARRSRCIQIIHSCTKDSSSCRGFA